MGLGFTKATGGDFLPSLRFNAVSGDCVIAGSKKSADGWEKYENEVKFPAKFVADFPNIEVGWIYFSASGPNFAMVKIGQPIPAKPSDKHKQGFRLNLFNKEAGLVTFANSSNTVKDVLNEVHDVYEADKSKHEGKLPVLEFKGTEKIQVKTQEGTKNYKKPVIAIVGWVVKPEGMTTSSVSETVAVEEDDAF